VHVVAGSSSTFVPVRFSAPPGPDLEPDRVIPALVLAAALLATAWYLIKTSDWSPPSEAATPELDAITLEVDPR
jgi:hypothetical protein